MISQFYRNKLANLISLNKDITNGDKLQIAYLESTPPKVRGIHLIMKPESFSQLQSILDNCPIPHVVQMLGLLVKQNMEFYVQKSLRDILWGGLWSVENTTKNLHVHLFLYFNEHIDIDDILEAVQKTMKTGESTVKVLSGKLAYSMKTYLKQQCGIDSSGSNQISFTIKEHQNTVFQYILKDPVLSGIFKFSTSKVPKNKMMGFQVKENFQKFLEPHINLQGLKSILDYRKIVKDVQKEGRSKRIKKDSQDILVKLIGQTKETQDVFNQHQFANEFWKVKQTTNRNQYQTYQFMVDDVQSSQNFSVMKQVNSLLQDKEEIFSSVDRQQFPRFKKMKKLYERQGWKMMQKFPNLLKWIKAYFVGKPQFRKMLVIHGNSQAGKTWGFEHIFLSTVFGRTEIQWGNNFQDKSAYNIDCVLWAIKDINERITKNLLLKLQNMVNGETQLCAKFENNKTQNKPRPIIACTTVDLVQEMETLESKLKTDVKDFAYQFKRRCIFVKIDTPTLIEDWMRLCVYPSGYMPDEAFCVLFWSVFMDHINEIPDDVVFNLNIEDEYGSLCDGISESQSELNYNVPELGRKKKRHELESSQLGGSSPKEDKKKKKEEQGIGRYYQNKEECLEMSSEKHQNFSKSSLDGEQKNEFGARVQETQFINQNGGIIKKDFKPEQLGYESESEPGQCSLLNYRIEREEREGRN